MIDTCTGCAERRDALVRANAAWKRGDREEMIRQLKLVTQSVMSQISSSHRRASQTGEQK